LELLTPVVLDSSVGVDVAAFAALSLGLVYVGTCNDDVAMAILQALMERGETELAEPLVRYFLLALGLLFLGQGVRISAWKKGSWAGSRLVFCGS
jgi:26S proteasome regulatory subunit N1